MEQSGSFRIPFPAPKNYNHFSWLKESSPGFRRNFACDRGYSFARRFEHPAETPRNNQPVLFQPLGIFAMHLKYHLTDEGYSLERLAREVVVAALHQVHPFHRIQFANHCGLPIP